MLRTIIPMKLLLEINKSLQKIRKTSMTAVVRKLNGKQTTAEFTDRVAEFAKTTYQSQISLSRLEIIQSGVGVVKRILDSLLAKIGGQTFVSFPPLSCQQNSGSSSSFSTTFKNSVLRYLLGFFCFPFDLAGREVFSPDSTRDTTDVRFQK